MVASTLGAGMRWDLRRPEKAFGDRFVLVAGHCCPVAPTPCSPSTTKHCGCARGDRRPALPGSQGSTSAQLDWEDLLLLRHNGHLPGHAEMEGKTLFFKFNTGPSGHGGAGRGGRGARAQARRRGRGQGLRDGGRGRAHRRRPPRGEELGLGPRARQPGLPARLERLRHRSLRQLREVVARRARRSGSSPTAGAWPGPRRASDYGRSPAPCSRSSTPRHRGTPGHGVVQDAQGSRLPHLRLQVPRRRHKRNSELFWKCRAGLPGAYGVTFDGLRRHRPTRRGRLPRADPRLVRDRLQRDAQGPRSWSSTSPTP